MVMEPALNSNMPAVIYLVLDKYLKLTTALLGASHIFLLFIFPIFLTLLIFLPFACL
ncbi:hypothetical protein Scep_030382 [Stephania cephalantha]|uniref:Uncharacterized protein n=1 Tax=Stephania cephalantha TaxID=152367 RepID=A0AAP0HGU3_9MAGN